MMPTSPRSPLSAGQRVFPSTAGRLAYQAGPAQFVFQLKPAPGIRCRTPGLSSPFVHLVADIGCPVLSRAMGPIVHRHAVGGTHLPQGPSLRSRLYCPGPSSLSRPHAPHSQAHRNFTAQRFICGAFAVRERLGDPRADPSFRCIFLPDMPPSTTPGSPTPISSRAAVSTLAFVVGIPPRHSQYPRNPFHAGGNFRGFLVHTFATACQFARPPVRI
jgi:hypothetical protein